MRKSVFGVVAAGTLLIPSVVHSDPIEVVLVPSTAKLTTDIGSQKLYSVLSDELSRSLALQGVSVLDLRDLGLDADEFISRDASAFGNFATRRLRGNDYAISISLTASIKRTSVSRVANLRAEGAVVDVSAGEILTTYSVDAPEGIILPLSEADCDPSCTELKLADAKSGLGRELSFVLTQKMHFLQEDGAIPQISDPVAISDRLKPTDDRPTNPVVKVGGGNEFTVDTARSLDIEVYFGPDSDALTDLARTQLAALGKALQNQALSEARYLIAGHTDATGAAPYNLALSERRAARVREYLIQNYLIAPSRLVAIGLGESQLKEPTKPNWGVNRRVEIALLLAGPTPAKNASELIEYSLTFNNFVRDDAMRVERALEALLDEAVTLELSNTTERVYALQSFQKTEAVEQAIFRALHDAGFDTTSVRLSVTGRIITLDKL